MAAFKATVPGLVKTTLHFLVQQQQRQNYRHFTDEYCSFDFHFLSLRSKAEVSSFVLLLTKQWRAATVGPRKSSTSCLLVPVLQT